MISPPACRRPRSTPPANPRLRDERTTRAPAFRRDARGLLVRRSVVDDDDLGGLGQRGGQAWRQPGAGAVRDDDHRGGRRHSACGDDVAVGEVEELGSVDGGQPSFEQPEPEAVAVRRSIRAAGSSPTSSICAGAHSNMTMMVGLASSVRASPVKAWSSAPSTSILMTSTRGRSARRSSRRSRRHLNNLLGVAQADEGIRSDGPDARIAGEVPALVELQVVGSTTPRHGAT